MSTENSLLESETTRASAPPGHAPDADCGLMRGGSILRNNENKTSKRESFLVFSTLNTICNNENKTSKKELCHVFINGERSAVCLLEAGCPSRVPVFSQRNSCTRGVIVMRESLIWLSWCSHEHLPGSKKRIFHDTWSSFSAARFRSPFFL